MEKNQFVYAVAAMEMYRRELVQEMSKDWLGIEGTSFELAMLIAMARAKVRIADGDLDVFLARSGAGAEVVPLRGRIPA